MAKAKKSAQWMPEGYEELSNQLDGYFLRKAGNTVEGRYLGSFISKSGKFGPKAVHMVQLTNGATLIEKDGKEGDASEGDTIGINETGYLKALKKAPEGSNVFILCEGKDGEDKQDPWIFKLAVARGAQ